MKSPRTLLLVTLPLLASVNATPMVDLVNLQASISSATNRLNASLNTTAVLNTSDIIQAVGYQIGASMANLGCVESATPSQIFNSSTNNQTTIFLEKSYLNYTTSLQSLSTALTLRGKSPHAEFDYPVLQQLQSLSRAVYNFGKCLRNGNYISAKAAIETWSTGSDLIDAETAWDHGLQNSNGMRKGKRDRKASVAVTKVRRSPSPQL